jgi:hypothetical protein
LQHWTDLDVRDLPAYSGWRVNSASLNASEADEWLADKDPGGAGYVRQDVAAEGIGPPVRGERGRIERPWVAAGA